MKKVEAWLRKEAERAARAPLLEDALIGGRFFPYAAYRLRYFALRTLLGAFLHALKVYFAYRFFSAGSFVAVLAVQAAASLAAGFWWGGLEALRARVREDFSARRKTELEELIGGWISFSLKAGSAILVGALAFLSARFFSPGGGLSAADLFLAAILFRSALDLPSRAYHSGVYALRRVYRPGLTIVLAELLSFSTLLASWPFLDVWSLPLASAVSSVSAVALVVFYTRRAYRRLGLSPEKRLRPFHRSRPRGLGGREWIAAGAAYAALRLDGLLPLALVGLYGRRPGSAATLVLAVGPLIRAGFEWVQLFYFDLVRLNRPVLRKWRERFERQVGFLALPAAVFFWLPASVAAWAYFGPSPWSFEAAFLLFFIGRGVLASVQMRAFARGEYAPIGLSAIIVLAGHAAAGAMTSAATGLFAAAAAATFVASAVARRRIGRLGGRPRDVREPLALSDWLAEARKAEGPASISMITIAPEGDDRGDGRWPLRGLAGLVASRLGGRGAAAVAGPGRVLWFERGSDASRIEPEWLFSTGAGRVETFRFTPVLPAGREALREAVARGFLGPVSGPPSPSFEVGRTPGPAVSEAVFAEVVARGTVISDDIASSDFGRNLTSNERRAILADAAAFAADFRTFRPRSAYDVTAFAEEGAVRRIFIIDRKTPSEARNRWRAAVRRLNLESVLADERPAPNSPSA